MVVRWIVGGAARQSAETLDFEYKDMAMFCSRGFAAEPNG